MEEVAQGEIHLPQGQIHHHCRSTYGLQQVPLQEEDLQADNQEEEDPQAEDLQRDNQEEDLQGDHQDQLGTQDHQWYQELLPRESILEP